MDRSPATKAIFAPGCCAFGPVEGGIKPLVPARLAATIVFEAATMSPDGMIEANFPAEADELACSGAEVLGADADGAAGPPAADELGADGLSAVTGLAALAGGDEPPAWSATVALEHAPSSSAPSTAPAVRIRPRR